MHEDHRQACIDYYHILSLKWTRGDQIVWWGPDDSGYVKNLAQAGVYTEEQVRARPTYYDNRDSTVAVPVEAVEAAAYRSVSIGRVEALIGQPVWATRDGVMLKKPLPDDQEEESD